MDVRGILDAAYVAWIGVRSNAFVDVCGMVWWLTALAIDSKVSSSTGTSRCRITRLLCRERQPIDRMDLTFRNRKQKKYHVSR